MTEIFKAILFGIVEGITEWLPISSTGHMILLEQFVSFQNVSDGFWSMFEVVIQLGAILAVVVLFWNQIFPFRFKGKPFVKMDVMTLWFKILVSCIPAAVIGVLFSEQMEALFYNYATVAVMLILFGIAFLLVENRRRNPRGRIDSLSGITYQTALMIGVFQLIAAVFPGTSRSGATIIGALLLGVSRTTAAEFTFFLAIPVMFGASLLKLVKFGLNFTALETAVLLTGMVTAFAVSVVVIRFLMDYIKKHDFKIFGWYRIVLGVVVLIYFMGKSGLF